MRLPFFRLIVLSSLLVGLSAGSASAEDNFRLLEDGTIELIQDKSRDSSSSRSGRSSAPTGNKAKQQKSRWNAALDGFENSHEIYKSKRQTTYFDGSFSFGKKNFSIVTLDYPRHSVKFDKVAAEALGKGATIFTGDLAAQGTKVQVQFLVPNEMVSFFVADESAKRGASFKAAKIANRGTIPLKLQFSEPRPDLNTDANGLLEIFVTPKEYRQLHHKRWEEGKISQRALKKLLSKRLNGRLSFKSLKLPDVSLAGPYERMPKRASFLSRVLILPKKAKGAWIQRSPEALATYRANQYYNERVARAKQTFEVKKGDLAKRIAKEKSEGDAVFQSEMDEAKRQNDFDKLVGKMSNRMAKRKYRASLKRIERAKAKFARTLASEKADELKKAKGKYSQMLARARDDKKNKHTPKFARSPREAGKYAERQRKARAGKLGKPKQGRR